MTAIEAHIRALYKELDTRMPVGQRLDDLRAVVGRTERRIVEAKEIISAAEHTLEVENKGLATYKEEVAELEAKVRDNSVPKAQVPDWLTNNVTVLIAPITSGGDVSREALVASLAGILIPPPELTEVHQRQLLGRRHQCT